MATPNVRSQDRELTLSEAIVERRSTASFDGSPVLDDALEEILRAGIEAPSSFNLQPWRFIVVRDTEQKVRLREAAMGQSKVQEAGAVIVCCGDPEASGGANLGEVLAEAAKHGFSKEQNQKVRETVGNIFSAPPGDTFGVAPSYAVWVNRHVMIALTTMMWMAEVLGYDTAPMEGFYEGKVRSALSIPSHIRVVALLAVGKRRGPDKPYAGRHEMRNVCFSEKWGESIEL
jgi:nitroreductase